MSNNDYAKQQLFRLIADGKCFSVYVRNIDGKNYRILDDFFRPLMQIPISAVNELIEDKKVVFERVLIAL